MNSISYGGWLGALLLGGVLSAQGAGEARFYGGARDGYDRAVASSQSSTVRNGWYTGGSGDGNAHAHSLSVSESIRSSWYHGAAGDGCSSSDYAGFDRAAWLRLFGGGSGDGQHRTMAAGLPNPLDRDSDGDSLPDWWELAYGEGLTVMNPDDDPDQDDCINEYECRAGTVPTNAASRLRLEAMVMGENKPFLIWQSADARRYRLERSTNLTTSSWLPVSTNIFGVAPMNTETDSTAVGSGPWFYRVELE